MLAEDEALNITFNAEVASRRLGYQRSRCLGSRLPKIHLLHLDILVLGNSTQTRTYLWFEGKDNAAAKAVGLDEYSKLIEEAGNEHKMLISVMKNMLRSSMADR